MNEKLFLKNLIFQMMDAPKKNLLLYVKSLRHQ